MNGIEISKQLKCDIELNQIQLKRAIHNHQNCLSKLDVDRYNVELQKEVNKAEEDIILIGVEQKNLLERLRNEYKAYQESLKTHIVKNGIEEKRFNLTSALNRARKQNIVARSASATSISDESVENVSVNSSPEYQDQNPNPLEPHDVLQTEFLSYFSLATHEVYKEMQNKRAERKGEAQLTHNFCMEIKKRKRNAFLISPVSPPHTRQSVRKKQERNSPPPSAPFPVSKREANGNSSFNNALFTSFPAIPNLPSGLIIERVSPGSSSPDSKTCVICKQPGAISLCEVCLNGFHISCHNRPLTQTPRQCPKCITKEIKTVGSLNVPSGMSVSYVTPSEVSEKLNEKRQLEEKKQNLSAELTQLQNRHSQLTVSLKNQKTHQEQLVMMQEATEENIKKFTHLSRRYRNLL